MAVKHGLGKGIAALLPDEDYEQNNTDQQKNRDSSKTDNTQKGIFISIDKIKNNPLQPRKDFNEEKLAELADSIREHGIIQPVIVEEAGNDYFIDGISENASNEGKYMLVAGERRFRAAKMAGLTEVPVIIKEYSEEKRFIISLIENIQRSDLNPIEEASAYKALMDISGLSQDKAAARVGKNRTTVANALRLLKLPLPMQESIKKAEISAGHARAILSLTNETARETLYSEILKKGLSVRETEKLAVALNTQVKEKEKEKPRNKARPSELNDMEEKFLKRLGTKVKIQGDMNKGSIIIDYYSMDDLDRLYDIIHGS